MFPVFATQDYQRDRNPASTPNLTVFPKYFCTRPGWAPALRGGTANDGGGAHENPNSETNKTPPVSTTPLAVSPRTQWGRTADDRRWHRLASVQRLHHRQEQRLRALAVGCRIAAVAAADARHRRQDQQQLWHKTAGFQERVLREVRPANPLLVRRALRRRRCRCRIQYGLTKKKNVVGLKERRDN